MKLARAEMLTRWAGPHRSPHNSFQPAHNWEVETLRQPAPFHRHRNNPQGRNEWATPRLPNRRLLARSRSPQPQGERPKSVSEEPQPAGRVTGERAPWRAGRRRLLWPPHPLAASPPRHLPQSGSPRFVAGSHNPSPIPTAGESNLVADADVRPPSLSYSARPPPSSSCSRGPPPATPQVLSMEVKHKKKPSTKKFTSPVVVMFVKSPGVRMMLSPTIRSPSAATKRSPTLTSMCPNCNRKHPNSSESALKTISDYRSRLTSDTVEALICLQDWLGGSAAYDQNSLRDLNLFLHKPKKLKFLSPQKCHVKSKDIIRFRWYHFCFIQDF